MRLLALDRTTRGLGIDRHIVQIERMRPRASVILLDTQMQPFESGGPMPYAALILRKAAITGLIHPDLGQWNIVQPELQVVAVRIEMPAQAAPFVFGKKVFRRGRGGRGAGRARCCR